MPPRAGSLADEALDLAFIAGREPDPWQELSLDAIFSVDEFGQWVCTEFGELVSRQNGKGDIVLLFELAHLFLWPKDDGEPKVIVHTAHEVKTAKEAFRRLKRVIKSSNRLMGELLGGERGIKDNNQERGFELANGNRLLFLARSKNSGVGFTVDVLVVDEAQQTPQSAMDALLPTMSAVENTQVLFTGTVPDELNDAEYWEGVRDRGRSGSDPRTGWIEYSPEGSEDPDSADLIDILDEANWLASNPGFGYRKGLNRTTIEDEISRLTPDAVRRLRFSVWPARRPMVEAQLSQLEMQRWRDNAQADAVLGDSPVIAIALHRGSLFATVSAAARADEDSIFVEHKRTERGTLWVASYVKQLVREIGAVLVVIDPKNAASIITDLDRAKVKYLAMNMNEVAAAHAQLIEYSNAGLVIHRGQEEQTLSFQFATTRPLGQSGGLTWEPSDPSKPITHAQAATWAVWAVKKHEANPKKPRTGESVFR